MSDNVIKLDRYRNPGNGARQALMKTLADHEMADANIIPVYTDLILASLWLHGFEVAPLERDD
jgi:hypothetical protein